MFFHKTDTETKQILEIGVERGQTKIPLIQRLIDYNVKFQYDAVDIDHCTEVFDTLGFFSKHPVDQELTFININSLKFLPWAVSGAKTYKHKGANVTLHDLFKREEKKPEVVNRQPGWGPDTIIMIDGDHNYGTVTQELEFCTQLSNHKTIIVIDDYNTKWAERNMYYAERDSHKHLDGTQRESFLGNKREGVRNAVIDF